MKRFALTAALITFASIAAAHNCPNEWKAIDAALKTDAGANFEQALRSALREMMKH